MAHRFSVLAAACMAAVLGAGAASLGAWDNPNRLTYLTFSAPVALPGVTLDAGTYAFEIADPMSSGKVVLVRNKARTRQFFQGMTLRVERPAADLRSSVSFGEARRGEPRPIVAWYPANTTSGLQFIYAR